MAKDNLTQFGEIKVEQAEESCNKIKLLARNSSLEDLHHGPKLSGGPPLLLPCQFRMYDFLNKFYNESVLLPGRLDLW